MTTSTYETALLWLFLDEASLDKTVSTRIRYHRIVNRLQYFLDQIDVTPHLGTDPAAMLEVERDFGRRGSFFRVFGATELVCCLPAFIEDPWLPADRVEARTQISLTGRLLRWLDSHRQMDPFTGNCALWEAQAAVKAARSRVTKEARTARRNVGS